MAVAGAGGCQIDPLLIGWPPRAGFGRRCAAVVPPIHPRPAPSRTLPCGGLTAGRWSRLC